MTYRLLGAAETPQQIADMLNLRRQELGLTMTDLDEIGGLAPRYCAKIFAGGYFKSLGKISMPVLLQAMGCRLAVVVDERPEALPAITRRAITERTLSAYRSEQTRKRAKHSAA